MKWFVCSLAGLGIAAAVAYAQDEPGAKSAKKSDTKAAAGDAKANDEIRNKVSYGFGFNQGKRLLQSGVQFNPELVAKGFADAYAEKDPQWTDEELEAAFRKFEELLIAERDAKMKAQAEENKTEGEKFLSENKKKEGVKSTQSGLQYEVLKSGKGATPGKDDVVTTHYEGKLIDGTVFDSSVKRGEPATFPVGGVIKGWTEILQMMKVGDKWRVAIPSDLAYGENPRPGGPIGPNAVLIFEIELLDVAKEEDDLDAPAPKVTPKLKLKTKDE